MLRPPAARFLCDREGQLQLLCPFSVFLLDFLALDLKLWLLLKLLLKTSSICITLHLHETRSEKRGFSVLNCGIGINSQCAWLQVKALCSSPSSLWITILTFGDAAGYQCGRDTGAITLLSRDLWSQSTENPLVACCERELNFQVEWKSNKPRWGLFPPIQAFAYYFCSCIQPSSTSLFTFKCLIAALECALCPQAAWWMVGSAWCLLSPHANRMGTSI